MPVVVPPRIAIVVSSEKSIVHDRFMWMVDQVAHGGIKIRHAGEILLNTLLVEIDGDEGGLKPRTVGASEHPQARGLASGQVRQLPERGRPQGIVQGSVIERFNCGECAHMR